MSERIVVAMSGGVDSSVAAALLVRQGCDVVGIMLRLWTEGAGTRHNRCCTPDDVDLARRVADKLEIPFYVLNAAESFKAQVVDPFVEAYVQGQTPNPCLNCNRYIRFGWLLNKALSLGATRLATGHYARCRQKAPEGTWELLRGLDQNKDQSYVLSVLTQAQLARLTFPLGELTKVQVRQIAEQEKLVVARKPDSQDLCFLAEGDYRQFLTRHAPPGSIRPGPIRDTGGRVIGQHAGLPFYTVGQRKGLGISDAQALYVLALLPDENALVVGPASELGRATCTVTQVNYTGGQPPTRPFRASVKIRYKASEVAATVTPLENACAAIHFDRPLRDITPGQAAVFYAGEAVIGGGIVAQVG